MGDSILGFVVSDYLYHLGRGKRDEGKMTIQKQGFVSTKPLAQAMRKLELHEFLLLGDGMAFGGVQDDRLLENLYEAIIGALYLDGGIEVAKTFITSSLINAKGEKRVSVDDYKSNLQIYTQSKKLGTPVYELIAKTGPDHLPQFTIAVVIGGKKIAVGNIFIGGDAPIAVQSMTNTRSEDFDATLAQIKKLQSVGCDVVRMACPTEDAARIFTLAKNNGVTIPMVADIHFDYKIALAALRAGADKIRINPGNIGESWKVEEVARACKAAGVPIRIGVNGGSLEKGLLKKYGGPTAEALAESALSQADMLEAAKEHGRLSFLPLVDGGVISYEVQMVKPEPDIYKALLEKYQFEDIVISIKSSTIERMVEACKLVAASSAYPIHLGVTEAGDEYSGLVKNSIGIGSCLMQGIGDTIRVSLTADPVREIAAGKEILSSLGLLRGGIDIVSCPTCGRTKIDLISLSAKFREAIEGIDTKGKKITCALMGCVVNGPGEAREADFGIAGGDGCAMLFRHGETVCKIDEGDIIPTLLSEIERCINE